MNLRSPGLWIAFFSVAAVSTLAIIDMERTSPGPLTAVHARVDELDGGSACSKCHGGIFTNMTEACLDCHATIGEQIEASKGLHGTLGKERASNCAVCHSEHHGESFDIVNRQSFAQAGVADPAKFDHQLVGFLMDGKHLEIGCADCHKHADDDVLPVDAQRFGGLDQGCTPCHDDPHKGRMVVGCTSCHGQSDWKELFSLGHEKNLALVGGHGDVTCRTCHIEGDWHSLESLGSSKRRPEPRTCVECHPSPHTSSFVDAIATQQKKPATLVCLDCHAAEHKSFREPGLTIDAAQHAASGFKLDAPHDKPACAQCHKPEGEFEERYSGRKPETCSACHADIHGGQFEHGPFAGQQCTACHDKLDFKTPAFTLEQHALGRLPLTGAHVETKCHECHVDPPQTGEGEERKDAAPRTFQGTPDECAACHADAHDGFFDEITQPMAEVAHGDCARCHDTLKFANLAPGGFDHAAWTDFAILGAHTQGDCTLCHKPAPQPDESGRSFGRIATREGAPASCSTCHQDVHAGRFDAPGMAQEVAGRTDCARCHVETSFRVATENFDHARWTGYPLVGAHAPLACTECHPTLSRAQPDGRTWAQALGTACASCHVDVHAGQFKKNGQTDCTRCHTSRVDSFLVFNHDRDSRFALGEAHTPLACSACHVPWKLEGGVEVVRYKPLGTECTDCHGVHDDALLRRKRGKQ